MSEGLRALLLLSPIFLAGFVVVGLAAVLVPSLLVWWVRRSRVVQKELDGVFLAQGFERVGATLVGTLGGERVSVRRNVDRLQLRVDGLPPGFVVGPRRVRVQDRWRRREGAQLASFLTHLRQVEPDLSSVLAGFSPRQRNDALARA